MRVTALVSMDYSGQGHAVPLRAGQSVDVPDELVEALIAHGFVEDADHDDELDADGWPEGVTPAAADALEAAGVQPDEVDEYTDEELLAIAGVGPATVAVLREASDGPMTEE